MGIIAVVGDLVING
jgi:hypothetical protein